MLSRFNTFRCCTKNKIAVFCNIRCGKYGFVFNCAGIFLQTETAQVSTFANIEYGRQLNIVHSLSDHGFYPILRMDVDIIMHSGNSRQRFDSIILYHGCISQVIFVGQVSK